jgi:hypothetical protein
LGCQACNDVLRHVLKRSHAGITLVGNVVGMDGLEFREALGDGGVPIDTGRLEE